MKSLISKINIILMLMRGDFAWTLVFIVLGVDFAVVGACLNHDFLWGVFGVGAGFAIGISLISILEIIDTYEKISEHYREKE